MGGDFLTRKGHNSRPRWGQGGHNRRDVPPKRFPEAGTGKPAFSFHAKPLFPVTHLAARTTPRGGTW